MEGCVNKEERWKMRGKGNRSNGKKRVKMLLCYAQYNIHNVERVRWFSLMCD